VKLKRTIMALVAVMCLGLPQQTSANWTSELPYSCPASLAPTVKSVVSPVPWNQ
jgi:hypothetical protein